MVGTRQQQTLGDKGGDDSEAEDHLLLLPRFGKNKSRQSTTDSVETSVAFL